MYDVDLEKVARVARQFSGLNNDNAELLKTIQPRVEGHLDAVTDTFCARLQQIEETAFFLEGRLDALKKTHRRWLDEIFSGDYGEDYVAEMFRVGETHVNVRLPLEFMSGATTIVADALIPVLREIADDESEYTQASRALNAVLGFSLMIMQESYHATSLANELSRFLKVTGMSRELFSNLADTESN